MLKGGNTIKKYFESLFNVNLNLSTLVASVLSVIFGVLATNICSTGTVSIKIFTIYICVSLFIIWLLLIIIFSPPKNTDTELNLKLIKFLSSKNRSLRCVLQPCSYVSVGSFLTFFYSDNELETYFATGIVSNIQYNKLITVDIKSSIDDLEISAKIANNNIEFIQSIIIKPIVTNNFIKGDLYDE